MSVPRQEVELVGNVEDSEEGHEVEGALAHLLAHRVDGKHLERHRAVRARRVRHKPREVLVLDWRGEAVAVAHGRHHLVVLDGDLDGGDLAVGGELEQLLVAQVALDRRRGQSPRRRVPRPVHLAFGVAELSREGLQLLAGEGAPVACAGLVAFGASDGGRQRLVVQRRQVGDPRRHERSRLFWLASGRNQ